MKENRHKVIKDLNLFLQGLKNIRSITPGMDVNALDSPMNQCRKEIEAFIARFSSGLGAPMIASIVGGTGVGKSTILNSLAGRAVSETSVRRPCTRNPLFYYHKKDRDFLHSESFLPGYPRHYVPGKEQAPEDSRVRLLLFEHSDPEWENIILTDVPDFDSVDRINEQTANDIFRVSDLIMLATNPSRYADEQQWKYIRKTLAQEKKLVYLFNQTEKMEVYLDFYHKLKAESLWRRAFKFPRRFEIMKEERFPDDVRELKNLKDYLIETARTDSRREIKRREMIGRKKSLDDLFLSRIKVPLSLEIQSFHELSRVTAECESHRIDEIDQKLASVLDDEEEIKQRINQLIRENIGKIADPLRRFRRVVYFPVVYAGRELRNLWKKFNPEQGEKKIPEQVKSLHEKNSEIIWQQVRLLQEDVRKKIKELSIGDLILSGKEWRALDFGRADVSEAYDKGKEEQKKALREKFERLTDQIKGQKSWRLLAVQILWFVMIISLEIGSGGGFVWFEGLIDALVFPVVAPMLIRVMSWDEFKSLTREAAREHQQLCENIIKRQSERYIAWVEEQAEGLKPLKDMEELYGDLDQRLKVFLNLRDEEEGDSV